MLGKRGPQRGLFEVDTAYGAFVGRDSFYGWLASQRGELFRDEEFAGLYVLDNGRPSVPPSLLATALVLQTYDGVSDEEAKQRADYDLRWKVALGVELDVRPFAKSTLQEFRAQLIVHEEQAAIFQTSLELAKRRGKFRTKTGEKRKLQVALDTTNILGRGAVQDTYNLLGDGIVKLARVLAKLSGQPLAVWAETPGYGRYVGPTSVKGTAEIDGSDASERRRFLGEIVSDADRLLEQARVARAGLEAGSAAEATLLEAAGLLSRCWSRTWSVERTARPSRRAWRRIGCCRSTTRRCGTGGRARASGSMGTRPRSSSTPMSRSSRRWRCWRGMRPTPRVRSNWSSRPR